MKRVELEGTGKRKAKPKVEEVKKTKSGEKKKFNSINLKTGKPRPCHSCDSEYHFLQACPTKIKREESANIVVEKSETDPLENLFDITLVATAQA